MPCAMRSPNGESTDHWASVCCGWKSPVCAAKATTSASVTVRPRLRNRSPTFRASKGAESVFMVSGSPLDLERDVAVALGGVARRFLVRAQAPREALARLRRRDDLVDRAGHARR